MSKYTDPGFSHADPSFLAWLSLENQAARREGQKLPLYADLVRQFGDALKRGVVLKPRFENPEPTAEFRGFATHRSNARFVRDEGGRKRGHLTLVVNNS